MNVNEPQTNYVKDGYLKQPPRPKEQKGGSNANQLSHITSFASLSDLTDASSTYRNYEQDQRYSNMEKEHIQFDNQNDDIYIVRQRRGYCSIFFSVVQTVILGCMLWQCGLAPMDINPMVGPFPDALSYWGGKNTVLILEDSEYWRLLTPIFLHAGVIHLLGNISVQLETGSFFEREWGSATWLAIYIVSALGSSIFSCDSMPNSISVGSSGAVMGLFGGKLSEVCDIVFYIYQLKRVQIKLERFSQKIFLF